MKRRKCLLRYFKCPTCGSMFTAPIARKSTHAMHVKTMYCYVCKTERDFLQTDSDKAK